MSEAANYQMPYSLRYLFATLLVYCNPANPKELWQKFESSMAEDFTTVPNIQKKQHSLFSPKSYKRYLTFNGSKYKLIYAHTRKHLSNYIFCHNPRK